MSLGDLTALARVLLGAYIAFGLLPRYVLPRPAAARSGLDAFTMNLLRWFALVIVLTHVLVLLGLYNVVTVGASLLAFAWFGRYRRELGGFGGLLQRMWPTGTDPEPATGRPLRAPMRERLIMAALASPVVALLGASYWLRVRHVFGTHTLSPPDAYLHMTWADGLQRNEIWTDGVYPMGFPALISFMDVLTPFTDILDVARFTGPLIGTFLVFAVYFTVVRLTRNPGAALLAAGGVGLLGANPEWRQPWERLAGMLPQELGLAVAIIAVAFAVLAVSEEGGGHVLRLGVAGGIATSGHVLTVSLAALAVAMSHPLPAAWLALLCGVGATAAVLVSRRFRYWISVGVGIVAGVVAGTAVVPLAEISGVEAYLGYGSSSALGDVTGSRSVDREKLLEYFGELHWLEHNGLSLLAGAFVAVALLGGVALVLTASTRRVGAQLFGLTAVGAVAVALFDVRPFVGVIDTFYVVRLTNLLGPTLALAFGAGLGGLGVLVARRPSYVRVAALLVVGALGLAGFGTRYPVSAIEDNYEREEIEWPEMAELTRRIKDDFDAGTYTVAGLTSQRQMLAGDGYFISLWVFARDVRDVPHDEILPVPTPETLVFVELDPYPVREIDGIGAVEEYYFDRAKRGRIMAATYRWAEERRRANPDTTVYYDGEHVRVYRIARNPAIRIDEDAPEFKDYRYRPGELYNDGPTSPRELEPRFDAVPVPDMRDGAPAGDQALGRAP